MSKIAITLVYHLLKKGRDKKEVQNAKTNFLTPTPIRYYRKIIYKLYTPKRRTISNISFISSISILSNLFASGKTGTFWKTIQEKSRTVSRKLVHLGNLFYLLNESQIDHRGGIKAEVLISLFVVAYLFLTHHYWHSLNLPRSVEKYNTFYWNVKRSTLDLNTAFNFWTWNIGWLFKIYISNKGIMLGYTFFAPSV